MDRIPQDGRRDESGFTLVEVVFALLVFVVGIGFAGTTMTSSMLLNHSSRETTLATNAAQSIVEAMRGEDFFEVYRRFNGSTADDPAIGVSPGDVFAVRGLNVRPDDPDGFVGRIVFPDVAGQLREDVVSARLGMPRDLNGDGTHDTEGHNLDYGILPVLVRVDWTGQSGDRSIEIATTLTIY